MCGVATLLTFNAHPLDAKKLQKMSELVAHRGPDGDGFAFWGQVQNTSALNESKIYNHSSEPLTSGHLSGVGLAHRRLAILDLTEAGRQPLSDPSGRYWITYNGEIYNYRELQFELKSKGYRFQSHTDTEVILAAYAEWGQACVSRFNGMWAFVIYDSQKQLLFASRDRFGVKPMYFAQDETSFAFASEIKQLHLSGFGSKRAARDQVTQFLLAGEINAENETCFDGISQLKPGHTILWDLKAGLGAAKIQAFYDLPEIASKTRQSYATYVEEFRELLQDSVRLRLRSDVEVGSCLSGGMDSSSIVLLMRELESSAKLKTFTSCFKDKAFDEWGFAQDVAVRAKAQSHQVFPDMEKIWEELPALIYHQDEPFGSTSIYAQWNVMRLANQNGIKVLLDGQGADEVMFGYHSYLPLHLASLLKRGRIAQTLASVRDLKKSGILGSTESLPRTIGKTAFSLLNKRSLHQPELAPLLKSEYQGSRVQCGPTEPRELRRNEIQGSLQALLRYEDRNSMAFSIEARTPFLDYRLVEFYLKLPIEVHYEGGWTKPLLRSSMQGLMPENVRLRVDKKGFVTPENSWQIKNFSRIQAQLQNSPLHDWFKADSLKRSLAKRELGSGALWRLLCTDLWMKRFNLQ